MPKHGLFLILFFCSALTAHFLAPYFIDMFQCSNHLGKNFRGELIPQGIGIIFVLCSWPWYALYLTAAKMYLEIALDVPTVLLLTQALSAISLLGFIDDMLGSRSVLGLRGHVKALLSRQLTTGTVKALGGLLIAFIISSVWFSRLVEIIVSTLVLALFTNLLNLLDLRPGRAIKFYLFLLFILGLSSFLTGTYRYFVLLLPLIGTVIGYFPFDLKARSMMGDAGSNVLGISAGMLAVRQFNYSAKLTTLVILIALHLFTERYSLSTVIANNRILSLFDNLGRQTNLVGSVDMISYRRGKVIEILKNYPGCTEIKVLTDSSQHRAINYDFFTGNIKPGDEVLLNTTAGLLGLGSGGYHFVVSVERNSKALLKRHSPTFPGHIMKLRYTPWQFAVMTMEEENSPYHQLFRDFKSLGKMPVIIGELHSMLLPAAFNIKRQNSALKIGYIMTDGGALPASYSRNIAFLKENNLIEGTVTLGQAFGGDFEAVNIYTALIGARAVLKADIAIVTMGPGITGTGTKYGFSGIEQGYIIDAVNTLGGHPVFIPRISFNDKRPRHYGISHHSLTILQEIAHTPATVVLPKLDPDKDRYIQEQIKTHQLDRKHQVKVVSDQRKVLTNIRHFPFKLTTMGRNLDQDREFFLTAGSAGYYSATMV